MKNFRKLYSLVLLLSLFGLSCRQITKSVNETFHPNDSLVEKYNKDNSFRQNRADEGNTKSSSIQRWQERTIAINSDTVNTAEMELKSKRDVSGHRIIKAEAGFV